MTRPVFNFFQRNFYLVMMIVAAVALFAGAVGWVNGRPNLGPAVVYGVFTLLGALMFLNGHSLVARLVGLVAALVFAMAAYVYTF